MRTSVIVPVYNGAAVIDGCLRSLAEQTVAATDYEIIVVDDGSTDDTPAILEGFAARSPVRTTVVTHERNAGPAAARNAGLRAATGEVIAFTDADCEVAPDWLERGLARLDAEDAPAAVEGRTDPKGDPGTLTHQMINEHGGLFMTCNMLYRRTVLDAVGGFDERFRLAFLEDSDVAFAVLDAGEQIAFAPDVLVHHLVLEQGRRKFVSEARKRLYNPLLASKHPEAYQQHLLPVVPGLPRIHLLYMFFVLAPPIVALTPFDGLAVLLLFGTALWTRRIFHAYRARDAVSMLQAAAHPFVQTFWVLRGMIRFRSYSFRI